MRAIDRALAVVEFDLNGHVLNANTNFLELMGYGLRRNRGQHHRIFCDPAYPRPEAYEQFWKQLQAVSWTGASTCV